MEKINKYLDISKKDMMEIKDYYYKNIKNSYFNDLVKHITLSDDIKMKYTSQLVEASTEFENCCNCKNLNNCKNKIKGYCYTPKENKNSISFGYQICKLQNKYNLDKEYLKNISLYEITSSLKEASIKDIYTDDKERIAIIKYFDKFIKNYGKNDVKGLYLNGSFGTGKTYLIAALFNEFAKKNIKSAIVYYPEFLRSLKESFDSDYKEKYDYIKKVPLLLLDDIGAEAVSSWSRDEVLGPILQYRMEEKLPIFFTSNLTIKELEEHLALTSKGLDKLKARRIIERITYITDDIKLISINRRK